MSNKYTDEHLNVDTLSGIGELYSTDAGNNNPKIETVGVSIDGNKTLSLKLGQGGTFPILDESIPKMSLNTDYMSFSTYAYDDVNDPAYELPSLEKYKYLLDKYMKQRQSFMIDVNSYNSQGMVMMTSASTIRDVDTVPKEELTWHGIKGISHVPLDFSSICTGLSTFLVAKISREKTIVAFDENGKLSMVLDHGAINTDFFGSIEYEITDSNKTFEDTISRQKIIIQSHHSNLGFYNLQESDLIEEMRLSHFDDTVEVMTSESLSPIDIDGKLLLYGKNFIFNKTRKCVRAVLDSGEILSLNPYEVHPVDGSSINILTVFKESFVKPSSVGYIGESTILYNMYPMVITSIDGKFIKSGAEVVIDIGNYSATVINGNSTGDKYFGQYETDSLGDIGGATYHQIGDGIDAVNAIKIGDKYLYFEGIDVFIKDESDVNFVKVALPLEKNQYGKREATFAGVRFSSYYDTLVGSVTKNSSFMYEVNYIISENSVDSEIIGEVHPIDFYRVEFTKSACSTRAYPMNDGHTTSKNKYEAGEVSHVFSKTDGTISVSNAKNSDDNLITYSYLSAFGRWSDEPFILESFGYVSEDTMLQSHDENFISKKLSSIEEARSKRIYSGVIDKLDSKYIVSWVKVRSIDQDQSFLFCENEYRDESQQHLGDNNYLHPGEGCSEPIPKLSKLSYVSNPFEYKTGISDMGTSMSVGTIDMHGFETETSIHDIYLGHIGGAHIKSQNKINGFGLNIVSVQVPTVAELTIEVSVPETISTIDSLWTDIFIVTIPEIGFIYNTTEDRYSNMQVISKTSIKEQFKRGVKYQFDGFYITGVLRWDTNDAIMVAEYSLVDELNGLLNHNYSVYFPDSVEQDMNPTIEEDIVFDPYDIVYIYQRRNKLDKLRMIPMYLANFLYSEFGFIQNILGVWDESSGVLISDSSVVIAEAPIESGFEVIVTCNGVEPLSFVDHYVTMSVYTFGTPYRISDNVRISISRQNTITKFSSAEMIEAEVFFEDGNKNWASKLTMIGYIKNFVESTNNDDILVEFSPSVFYPQGPWQNPHMYAKEEDMIMQEKSYAIEIMPRTRIITEVSVTAGNIIRFSHPAKRFTKVYEIVDGFVKREVLTDLKEDDAQRGKNTYAMEYVHHVGGGVNLNRYIYGDLLLYPSRHSYPINNLIRELISPIREDAHAKAMDARAIFSRFDTRYVSNTIPSYYDKFLEFPTAFTCDALPEESVLVRDLTKTESLYAENILYIRGDDIVGDSGVSKLSFSNDTDLPITVTMSYDNYKWGNGVTSFDINDAYLLQINEWLLYEPIANKRVGRVKSGIYLKGTTI